MSGAAIKAREFTSGTGGLDWSAFLTWLAQKYRGHAGLIVQDFLTSTGEVINWSSHTPKDYIQLYGRYSATSPWRNFMWREDPGFFILGAKVNPVERSEGTPFHNEVLRKLDLLRGMGAVLWKDKPLEPHRALAVGVIRPESEGFYSEAEQQDFLPLIPLMLAVIGQHPWVAAHDQPAVPPAKPVRPSQGRERRYNNDVPAKSDIIAFLQKYLPGSPSEKAGMIALLQSLTDPEAAQFAARLARGFATQLAGGSAASDAPEEAPSYAARIRAQRPAAISSAIVAGAQAATLPDQAPESYEQRPLDGVTGRRETVVAFLDRVWLDPWIKAGVLTRPLLAKLDPPCARALKDWLSYEKNRQAFPEHLKSLLQSEASRRQPTADEIREARRLLRWAERHGLAGSEREL